MVHTQASPHSLLQQSNGPGSRGGVGAGMEQGAGMDIFYKVRQAPNRERKSMNAAKIIYVAGLVGSVLFGPLAAAKQDVLEPLLATDIPAVCACTFVRHGSKGEGPILHWASDGKKQAVLRTEGQRHVLELRQERHMPERAGSPQPNDRIVLFVANGDWQVQVLGAVMGPVCSAKRQCTETRYQGRLLVQQEGGARTEIPVDGSCGCPKP